MLVRATLEDPAGIRPDRDPAAGHGRHERQRIRVRPERAGPNANDVLQFERRQLVVAEERDDHVVVKTGLKPGEHVASNGSLVLAQLYEDQQMVATGMPLK